MNYPSHQEIVDLLILALYQDGHLSVEEDTMLQKALKALGWTESEQSGPSVAKAFSAVRAANACEETKETFLAERTLKIKEAGESAVAFEWLGKVLASDDLDAAEARFFDRVQKMLFD